MGVVIAFQCALLVRGAAPAADEKVYRLPEVAVTANRVTPDMKARIRRILLEPLNSEFEALELNPDEDAFRIIAEFVQVLD